MSIAYRILPGPNPEAALTGHPILLVVQLLNAIVIITTIAAAINTFLLIIIIGFWLMFNLK
jgi:hypothetical protein